MQRWRSCLISTKRIHHAIVIIEFSKYALCLDSNECLLKLICVFFHCIQPTFAVKAFVMGLFNNAIPYTLYPIAEVLYQIHSNSCFVHVVSIFSRFPLLLFMD